MLFIRPHISGDTCCNPYIFPSLLVNIRTKINSKISFDLEAPIQTRSLRNYFPDEETSFTNCETWDVPLIFLTNHFLESYFRAHPDSQVSNNPGESLGYVIYPNIFPQLGCNLLSEMHIQDSKIIQVYLEHLSQTKKSKTRKIIKYKTIILLRQ